MRRESDFRGALGQAIRATHNIAQPIESGTTGLGIPDMFIRTSKTSAWLELKNLKYGLQFPFVVPFRPGQAAWLERYYKLGGLSILGIAVYNTKYFFVNQHIQRTYPTKEQFEDLCDYQCEYIIGRDIVRWLDNLQDNQ